MKRTACCENGKDDTISCPLFRKQDEVIKGCRDNQVYYTNFNISSPEKGERPEEFRSHENRLLKGPHSSFQGATRIGWKQFIVADDERACEDFLISLPVLTRLRIDSLMILESRRTILERANFYNVVDPIRTAHGLIGRLMLLTRVGQVKVNVYKYKQE